MKFTPLTFAAVLAVLFAAIILSHIFAPGAVALVASLASAAFAALMQFSKTSKDDEPKDPPATGGTGGGLKVIAGGLSMLAFLACGPKEPAKDPLTAAIEKCNAEARADDYVGQLPIDEILRRWDECMNREGQSH